MHLGKRLLGIAAMVPMNAKLADIGTDHAYLPIYLLHNGYIRYAIAGEVNHGPYNAAQESIKAAGLESKITLRLGNGLEVLRPGEVDTVIIAGMGGVTITEILSASANVINSLDKLVLQPMNGAVILRRWLVANNWTITDESLVREDKQLYEIIAAEQGKQDISEEILYDIGPVLWQKQHPLLLEHIQQLAAKIKHILAAMTASEAAENSYKYHELSVKLNQLEAKQRACKMQSNC